VDEDILQQLPGDPKPQSRWDVLYNNLVPSWLKDTPGAEMPPPGATPGKIGPPSGPPSFANPSPDLLPEVLSWLAPGGKAAGAAAKEVIPAIFAGMKAKTANLADLDLAVKMGQRGMPREQIHDATKWFAGADKNPKFEINDSPMRARPLPAGIGENGIQGSVAGFIHHPELFKAYPDIKNVTVHINPKYGPEDAGQYQPWDNKIIIGGKANERGLTGKQQITLLHELQHHVQGVEGFGQGTNPDYAYETVRDALWNKFQKMPGTHPAADTVFNALNQLDKHGRDLGSKMYWNTPGETEARNVSNRLLYSDAEIKKYPWETEDVPRSQQFEYVKKALGK
jgi:hypothetical protein